MAIFDARQADQLLDMTNVSLARFGTYVSSSPTSYVWNTASGDRLMASGTGISIAGNNRPTSTSDATSLRFDLGSDGSFPSSDIDVLVRNIDTPIATLLLGQVSFWDQVLRGDDIIYAPTAAEATIFGDQLSVRFRNVLAGDDAIRGGNGPGQTLIGDVDVVNGLGGSTPTALLAGNDTIVAYSSTGTSTLIGDVTFGLAATLTGGADRLTGSDAAADIIIGDFDYIRVLTAVAGDDQIYGRGGNDTIYGDVRAMQERFSTGNQLTAGDDLIFGGAGNDTVSGDIGTQRLFELGHETGQRLAAGNDRIFGGSGTDTLYGDKLTGYVNFDSGSVNRTDYGSDRIWGGADNDLIYGDASRNMEAFGGHDVLWGEGGADRLYGNVGNDRMFGGTGDDTLHGGLGNDKLSGGADSDTFVFADSFSPGNTGGVDLIFDFEDDIDSIEIGSQYGFADAQAVVDAATVAGRDVTLHLSADDRVTLLDFGSDKTLLLDDLTVL